MAQLLLRRTASAVLCQLPAKAAARSAQLGHSMLWVDWHEHWYAEVCAPGAVCPLKDADADGTGDLAAYLER